MKPSRLIALAVLLLAAPASAAETSYENPVVRDGADPAIVQDPDSGRWYLFTTDNYQTARRSSPDGVSDWSEKDTAYPGDPNRQGWAPSLRKAGDTWYMYTVGALTRSDSPDGTFQRIGKTLGFDPQVYQDPENDQYYFLYGGSHMGHVVAEMTSPTELGQQTALYFLPATDWGWTWEGLYVRKIGDTYYLVLSANSANSPNYRMHYATAPHIDGPYTLQSDMNEAAFLRRSDYENIVGPGHHAMTRDQHGTFWVYYQQHNDQGRNWNRGIALDPLWIDDTGVMHMRPTRGKKRPGPGSKPANVWPTVDAAGQLEAETYDGSRYVTLADGGSGTIVGNFRHDGFVAYRNVDFGDGLSGFTARVANAGTTPASIDVRLGGVHGESVGSLTVPSTGGWDSYQSLSAPLAETITGKHDVVLVASARDIASEALRLDWFTFEENAEGEANLPPVAKDDEVITRAGQPVTLDPLANDQNLDGDSPELTSVGGVETLNRSRKAPDNNLAIRPDGEVTYRPPQDYWGTDRFYYAIADGQGGFARGTVTVYVQPAKTATVEDGLAVVEAENFVAQRIDEEGSHQDESRWETDATLPGHVGKGYVTTPENGTSIWTGESGGRPRGAQLDYALQAPAGRYWLWARVHAPDDESNTAGVFFATDSQTVSRADVNQTWVLETSPDSDWQWVRLPRKIALAGGLVRFGIRRGEDGMSFDRFVITDDSDYDPADVESGLGPID
ncbi:MAG: family 43 glycosylhydrolase [Phycisphaeraceae bacterium]